MYLDDAVTSLSLFENRIHWMYLDTTGNVTTGIGQCIPSVDAALSYPFHRPNAELADHADILRDYEAVCSMPPGMTANFYRRDASLLLTDPAIDSMLRTRLIECVTELSASFPMFHSFPDGVKVGLLDMRFNLGMTNLLHEFPLFCGAIRTQHWALASVECNRIGIAKARNEWTKDQFFHAIDS